MGLRDICSGRWTSGHGRRRWKYCGGQVYSNPALHLSGRPTPSAISYHVNKLWVSQCLANSPCCTFIISCIPTRIQHPQRWFNDLSRSYGLRTVVPTTHRLTVPRTTHPSCHKPREDIIGAEILNATLLVSQFVSVSGSAKGLCIPWYIQPR